MSLSQIDHDTELRTTLFKLLSQTTLEQQKFFEKLYPKGISQIPYNKLIHAIMQCQRTIQKNKLNGVVKPDSFNDLMNEATNNVNKHRFSDEEIDMLQSLKKAKESDYIVSITKSEPKSDEEIKLPITKLKHEFKCNQCGDTNKELQFLNTEYCYICVNK